MNGKERIKMEIRMWLDDRSMPEGFDIHAKSAYYAIGLIISGKVDYISFDHDLGFFSEEEMDDPNNTGYAVAKFIEELAHNENIPIKRIGYDIHSDNPVGRQRIKFAMQSAEKAWDKREIEW
jgi:hypothetical protein